MLGFNAMTPMLRRNAVVILLLADALAATLTVFFLGVFNVI